MPFKIFISTVLTLYLYPFGASCVLANSDEPKRDNLNFYHLVISDPDSALKVLPILYKKAKEEGDTNKQVHYLLHYGNIYLDKLNYPEALNFYTEALFLAEHIGQTQNEAQALNRLGKIHVRFGKVEVGEKYLHQSLEVAKQGVQENVIRPKQLISFYLDFSIHEKVKGNYNLALQYLDTCFIISKSLNQEDLHNGFILAEKADLLIKTNKLAKAVEILYPLEKFYNQFIDETGEYTSQTSNLSLVLYYIAKVLKKENKGNEALVEYLKALESIKMHDRNLPLQPIIFKEMADIYVAKGDYKLAYFYLLRSKQLNENYFSTNSKRNIDALTLKDSYREALDKKEKQLIEEKLKLLEKEKTILRFRTVIILIILFIFIGVLLIRNRFQKVRNQNEQELIRQKLEEKEKHAQVLLELKNKELTRYALQLMERDELLDQYSEHLKKNSHSKQSRSLIIARKQLKVDGWEEFDKRFVSINDGFYERLSKSYPSLTLTDQKHCALLKLKLSGKEAAKILGISDKSIHMAHYRIRKKLNLNGETNLMEFINEV